MDRFHSLMYIQEWKPTLFGVIHFRNQCRLLNGDMLVTRDNWRWEPGKRVDRFSLSNVYKEWIATLFGVMHFRNQCRLLNGDMLVTRDNWRWEPGKRVDRFHSLMYIRSGKPLFLESCTLGINVGSLKKNHVGDPRQLAMGTGKASGSVFTL